MVPFILAGGLSVACLATLVRQRKSGRGSAQFVTALCPIGLLFITLPLSGAVLQLIRGFRAIAASGPGGLQAIAPFCLAIPRALALGALAFLATMVVAAVAQTLMSSAPGEPSSAQTSSAPAAKLWTWVLAASCVMILPVVAYARLAESLPDLVMHAAASVRVGAGPNLGETSKTIAAQSVGALVGGVALSLVLAAFGIANTIAVARGAASAWLTSYSWLVLAGAVALGYWSITRASADLRAFEAMLR